MLLQSMNTAAAAVSLWVLLPFCSCPTRVLLVRFLSSFLFGDVLHACTRIACERSPLTYLLFMNHDLDVSPHNTAFISIACYTVKSKLFPG